MSYDLGVSAHEYAVALTNYMATLDDLDGLLDDIYLVSVGTGNADPAEVEL